MMKKISYIYAIIILILFLFVPGFLNASTYYDWERVQVDTLPEANKENMNKVYIKDDKYYVVKENVGGVNPIPLGHSSVSGDYMYVSFPSDIFDLDIYKNLFNYSDYVSKSIYIKNFILISNISDNQFNFSIYCGNGMSCGNFTINLSNFSYVYKVYRDYVFPDNFDVSFFSQSWIELPQEYYDFAMYVYNHISITALENTYEWLEVDKYQVKEIKLDERDFYLFYDFDDIKEFNILSNYDLESFTDFQKVVIVLGFNILFLGIIGLSIYIFIKLVYKGISMIFKF